MKSTIHNEYIGLYFLVNIYLDSNLILSVIYSVIVIHFSQGNYINCYIALSMCIIVYTYLYSVLLEPYDISFVCTYHFKIKEANNSPSTFTG